MKALNTKGVSDNSQEIRERTRVDRIPMPQRVAFDKNSNTISLNIPPTCLPLIALVETMSNENVPITAWQVVDTLELQVSGLGMTYKEKVLDMGIGFKGRSLSDEPIGMDEDLNPKVRVKLCLQTHPEHCGEFVDAERK